MMDGKDLKPIQTALERIATALERTAPERTEDEIIRDAVERVDAINARLCDSESYVRVRKIDVLNAILNNETEAE